MSNTQKQKNSGRLSGSGRSSEREPDGTGEADLPLRPPEGFKPSTTRGPYTSHNGPFFHKVTDTGFWHGVRVQKRHCNSRGITHGGMLMSFADGLLGTAVFRETQTVALTARMNADFLSSARPGEWLEGTARVTKATKSVVFCEAELFVGKRSVMKATGVFKLMARHKEKEADPS